MSPRLDFGSIRLASDLEMGVDRLAGDEQPHDLGRALEDQVDPPVAEGSLDRVGPLATVAERIGGFVAAPALDLYGVVGDSPAGFRVPHLGDRRLEPDVGLRAIGEQGSQVAHRLHGERLGRHPSNLLGHRVVLADRLSH